MTKPDDYRRLMEALVRAERSRCLDRLGVPVSTRVLILAHEEER